MHSILTQQSHSLCLHRVSDSIDSISTSNSLPSPFKTMALPVTSPNSKLSLTSPKRSQKREEGWKEVVRRSVQIEFGIVFILLKLI